MTCQECLDLLYELLDNELEAERRAEVLGHAEDCAPCYAHLNFERKFLDQFREVCAAGEPADELRNRLMALLGAEPG